MHIRHATLEDEAEWLRMRLELWPAHTVEEHLDEMRGWAVAPSQGAIFVAERPDGALCGFAEAGMRGYAEGCRTSPVAYLEGWFVDVDVRRQGVGAALVQAVEAWAREHGYSELASDALLENVISQEAHQRLGFSEVERTVQFRKDLQ